MGRRSRIRRALAGTLLAALASAGCASSAEAPGPGQTRGFVPDLSSATVLVMPVQRARGVPGGLDDELAFQLRERGSRVRWVMPDEARRAVERAPGLDATVDRLPVEVFLVAEVDRVGDPLYGALRRAADLVGAEVVLLPVEVRYRPAASGPDGAVAGAVEVVAALIAARTGRVIWFGVIEGAPAERGNLPAAASALEALARTVVPVTDIR
ncbi:MAG: hypothetical protein D6701_05675 [Gemmatimonadetes bacterium]|nr:MAG: hypothetical protein D6701_05675 [Gemmatimonadota bacterium]